MDETSLVVTEASPQEEIKAEEGASPESNEGKEKENGDKPVEGEVVDEKKE